MIKLPDTEGLQDRVRLAEHTGPGPRLRAAREASGFEIDEIAKQLRLHPHIIDDLEHDTFADHLALVFVRGYLRAYANLIGLDPNQVVDEFNALGFQEARDLPDLKGKPESRSRMRNHQDMNRPTLSPGLKWAGIITLVVTLGGIFVAYNYSSQEETLPPPIISIAPEVTNSVEESAATDAGIPTESPELSVAPTPSTAPVATPPVARPVAPTPPVQAAPAPAPKPAAPEPAPTPSYEEEEEGPDAHNEIELVLPKPGAHS